MLHDRQEIIQRITDHRDALAKMGARSLALFGSAARGELQPDSDIDILVEMAPPYTFDRYIKIKFYLEDLLGRSVDLVMTETLKPRVRPYVDREAIYVS
jgi:predicted nucleotidyltransferase